MGVTDVSGHIYDDKTCKKVLWESQKISDSDSWGEIYGLCFIISLRTKNAIAATTIGIVAR